jgi:hypothetical protein
MCFDNPFFNPKFQVLPVHPIEPAYSFDIDSAEDIDSNSEEEEIEGSNIDILTLSPAGATPTQTDFPLFQWVTLLGAGNRSHL